MQDNGDPRQAEVWGKKPEVADRTLNERKYCKPCDYYYSEMFTCPICYGEERERQRIIKLAKNLEHRSMTHSELCTREHYFVEKLITAINGESNG